MFELIVIIIVIAVIVSKVKAQNKNAGNTTIYVNGKPVRKQQNTYTGYRSQAGGYQQKTGNYAAQKKNAQRGSAQGVRKNEYQQPNNAQRNRRPVQQDILSRAKQNVAENKEDVLERKDRMQHQAAGGMTESPAGQPGKMFVEQMVRSAGQKMAAQPDGERDIQREINDLMVMGYSGTLEFDRDFIAEGMDMLNRYQLSGNQY